MKRTLKIVKYKGYKIYARSLYDRWYECLVSFRGDIYAHQLYVEKSRPNEKRASLKERDEGATGELINIGVAMIDQFIIEEPLHKHIQKVAKQKLQELYVKSTQVIRSTRARIGVSGRRQESVPIGQDGGQEASESGS